MWNPFEVLFKQRLQLLLLAVKMLPTRVPYLFLLICVSNVVDNLYPRLINVVFTNLPVLLNTGLLTFCLLYLYQEVPFFWKFYFAATFLMNPVYLTCFLILLKDSTESPAYLWEVYFKDAPPPLHTHTPDV